MPVTYSSDMIILNNSSSTNSWTYKDGDIHWNVQAQLMPKFETKKEPDRMDQPLFVCAVPRPDGNDIYRIVRYDSDTDLYTFESDKVYVNYFEAWQNITGLPAYSLEVDMHRPLPEGGILLFKKPQSDRCFYYILRPNPEDIVMLRMMADDRGGAITRTDLQGIRYYYQKLLYQEVNMV